MTIIHSYSGGHVYTKDSFYSAFVFFRAHKFASFLLVICLSLIFFACLYLHALSRTEYMMQEQVSADTTGLYIINYQPADQAATKQLIETMYQSGYPINELNIYGELELLAEEPSTVNAVTQDSTDFLDKATPVPSNTNITAPLIGISDDPELPIDVVWGTSQTADDEVLLSEMSLLSMFGVSFTSSPSDIRLSYRNGEPMKVAGIVNIPSYLNAEGVIVRQQDFFKIATRSSSLQVLFSSALTEEQERVWISSAKNVVTISDIKFPVKEVPVNTSDAGSLTLLSRICILACLLCAMRLMAYLFLLRQQELTILRILGARLEAIQVRLLVMMFIISAVSIAIGMAAFLLLVASGLTQSFLPTLYPQLLVEDTLFFAISILIIGFYMFSRHLNFDVSHASEEV